MIRRTLLLSLAALAVLALIVGINTARQSSRQLQVPPVAAEAIDGAAAAERLAAAVRLRTVSYETPSAESRAALLQLHTYLAEAFPKTHATLRRETVNDYSLLYTWPGSDPAAAPILLMAHQDVVPVAPGTEASWHAAPFAGEIRDGYVWGRGTWDDKGNVMAILEGVERLIARGFQPRQTVYLAFGHDEENGGRDGARAIAALLKSRGVHLSFVLDEGMLITLGMIPGLEPPAALVGVAEKGYLTLKLTAEATPGHSSMPGNRSAIGALAAALMRLEHMPMPAAIRGTVAEMFDTLAPEMHGFSRVVLTNRWLFGHLLKDRLAAAPATNALMRTTTAETMIRAGDKENVLPGSAAAWINFRLLPGDTIAAVLAHTRHVVADERIRIEVLPGAMEPSPVSPIAGAGYQLVSRTVRELYPGVLVAPGLLIGGTDSRHMADIADGVYRFSPVRATSADLARFHGTDERIAIDNYVELIRFYERLLENAAQPR